MLCYVFMAVVASLLLCSGDVETNPGPPECECPQREPCCVLTSIIPLAVELIPDNLKKLCNLLTDARPNWFKLGFQLDIQLTELKIIEMNRKDVDACYIEMLSTWLKMIDPQPSWDGLLTALEHDSVKCGKLADGLREKYGIPKNPQAAKSAANVSSGERKSSIMCNDDTI